MKVSGMNGNSKKLLTGFYFAKVDSKGRFIIPLQLRQMFGSSSLYLIVDLKNKCLYILDETGWKQLATSQKKDKEQFYSSSFAIRMDKQGRVLIPQQVLEEVGLKINDRLRVAGIGFAIKVSKIRSDL